MKETPAGSSIYSISTINSFCDVICLESINFRRDTKLATMPGRLSTSTISYPLIIHNYLSSKANNKNNVQQQKSNGILRLQKQNTPKQKQNTKKPQKLNTTTTTISKGKTPGRSPISQPPNPPAYTQDESETETNARTTKQTDIHQTSKERQRERETLLPLLPKEHKVTSSPTTWC